LKIQQLSQDQSLNEMEKKFREILLKEIEEVFVKSLVNKIERVWYIDILSFQEFYRVDQELQNQETSIQQTKETLLDVI